MKRLQSDQLSLRGELSYRILKNYARLEGKEYRPETIFGMDKAGWPADWEGRTILALVLLWKTTGREPAFLSEILTGLKSHLNERGYLGKILPPGEADEQQTSGHNWLLRGLLELYAWKKDPCVKNIADDIVENLYLPLEQAKMYEKYPVDPSERSYDNARPDGHLQENMVNGWKISTDIGCAFMSLDGLSQYYQMFGGERVLSLLRQMIASYKKVDFLSVSMQTHASLTAARSILRLYQATGEKELLEAAVWFFDFYEKDGMTENYANRNWFGRAKWTEPCAIVDSYLLAVGLFEETHKPRYLEIANKILYAGLGYAQRSNGGFGCDVCAGHLGHEDIHPYADSYYEAFWCCSMRGAEGLTSAAFSAVLQEGDKYYLTNFLSGDYRFPELDFTVETAFPNKGEVSLSVHSCPKTVQLCFYLPQDVQPENAVLQINGKEMPFTNQDGFIVLKIDNACELLLTFPLEIKKHAAREVPGRHVYWKGYLMLGILEGEKELAPINDSIYRSRESLLKTRTQLLFD